MSSLNAEVQDHSTTQRYSLIVLACVLLAATAVRYSELSLRPLNGDESLHFQVSKEKTLGAVYLASQQHSHPPLIFSLYHFWIQGGHSEVFLRWPAFVFSVLACGVAFFWLRNIFGDFAAIAGVAFLAFSPPLVYFGQEMRGYSLLLLFCFASLYFLERMLAKSSWRPALAFTLFLNLAILTHYSATLFASVLGLYVLVRILHGNVSATTIRYWLAGQLVTFTVCLCLYFTHVRQFQGTGIQAVMWEFQPSVALSNPIAAGTRLILVTTLQFFGGLTGQWWWLLVLPMPFICLARFSRVTATNSQVGSKLSCAVLTLFPFALAWGLVILRIYPFGPTRHSVWLYPFTAFAIAGTVAPIPRSRNLLRFALIGGLLLGWCIWIVWSIEASKAHVSPTRKQLREAVTVIRERIPPTVPILVDVNTRNVLDYYLAEDPMALRRSRRAPETYREYTGEYEEYEIDGYRICSLPDHSLRTLQWNSRWPEIENAYALDSHKPIAILHFGGVWEDYESRLPRGSNPTTHTFDWGQVFILKSSVDQ